MARRSWVGSAISSHGPEGSPRRQCHRQLIKLTKLLASTTNGRPVFFIVFFLVWGLLHRQSNHPRRCGAEFPRLYNPKRIAGAPVSPPLLLET